MLFDHIQDALLHRYARPWMQTGQHGVTIFFVLSGFLITTKLIESPAQSPAPFLAPSRAPSSVPSRAESRIAVRRFFVRRFFRLMPVAWAFLAAMLLFDQVAHVHFLSWTEVRACLFFYRNFIGVAGGGAAGHFWSLSLEEQFYLVWPLLLVFAGLRNCRWIAAAGAIACAVYRDLCWAHYDRNLLDYQTQVRADALLIGCLLALLLPIPQVRTIAIRSTPYAAPLAIAALFYGVANFHWLVPLTESVAIALLIAASVLHPKARLALPLSFRPLAWLGTISYSVYVWQALFMLPWSEAIRPWLLAIGLPSLSLMSFYWLEQPLARLGQRLTQPAAHRTKTSPVMNKSKPAASMPYPA